ncbi:MAG: DNA topoisomerase IB [Ignavibacteria bacterium]
MNDDKKTLENIPIPAEITDPVQTAKAMHLVYVNSGKEGFSRKRSGKSFIYFDGNKKIKDEVIIERIKKLILPPAWEKVWICKLPNGHLQATGIDKMGRKQYKYHANWSTARNNTKFHRLYDFGKKLPDVRIVIQKNLDLPGFQKEKVLSALLSILERTNIRIGNSFYEKLYGSFGLTTMKNRHVSINGAQISFAFKGKKGVNHKISLQSKKLANIIKGCKDISGKELFEFIDDKGEIHNIDSGMVNDYLRDITGSDFTAKDFRTWAGSVQAIIALKEIGGHTSATELKQKLPQMFDLVAKQLGNTKAVCKKYYIHPSITELYENNKLETYLSKLDASNNKDKSGLTPEEKVLMKILKKC